MLTAVSENAKIANMGDIDRSKNPEHKNDYEIWK